jgi:hypothetical protein
MTGQQPEIDRSLRAARTVIDPALTRLMKEPQMLTLREAEITVLGRKLYAEQRSGLVRVCWNATRTDYLYRPLQPLTRQRAPWGIWLAYYLVGVPVQKLRNIWQSHVRHG